MVIDKKIDFSSHAPSPSSSSSSSSPNTGPSSAHSSYPASAPAPANIMGNPNADYQSISQHRPGNEVGDDQHQQLPPPAYASSQPQGPWDAQHRHDAYRRKRSIRRAVHWTLAAIAVLLLWKVFFASNASSEGAPYPPASDGSPSHWAHWSEPVEIPRSEWPSTIRGPYYSTTTNFTLDPTAATLFLHAKGTGYGGHVDYVLSESSSGKVEVGVQAVYNGIGERDRITIAKMDDSDKGRQGVGIYSERKQRNWNDGSVRIYVTFALPRRDSYQTLDTDVDNLRITVADLGSPAPIFTRFEAHSGNGALHIDGDLTATETVIIRNGNGRIQAKGRLLTPNLDSKCDNGGVIFSDVVASDADVFSGNGHVEGTFHVSHHLALNSDNGAIDAKVYVEKARDSKTKPLAGFFTSTSSGGSNDDEQSRVDVQAISSNGRVTLTYAAQDAAVLLSSKARSDTGHVTVRHADTFVGDVDLGTDVGHLSVRTPPTSGRRVWEVVKEHKGLIGHQLQAKLYRRDHPDALGSSTAYSDVGAVDAIFE
ncbi:hypothetical protein OC835_005643 [Tilletia horrida]|nr:hypothetical protein OC835_005643 [Tilletia horrida]